MLQNGLLLRWLDILAPIYFSTALLASIVSFYWELIGGLASRGKTRPAAQEKNDPKQPSALDYFLYGSAWSVPKRLFVTYYIVGTATLGVICLALPAVWPFSVTSTAILMVHTIHVLRRMYECLYVHQFGKNSQMHIFFCVLAALYYVLIPAVLVDLRDVDSTSNSPQPKTWVVAVVASFGLWAQYQQYRHHVLLANLRKPCTVKTTNTETETSGYTIPTGGWFQYVACPHYLAEVLLYVSYAVLIGLDGRWPEPAAAGSSLSAFLHEFRFVFAFLFCFCNLLFSALESHAWYLQKFGDTYRLLHRKAMIPFIV
jgi:3-oxo-5-alpha-steroid 4-dehydrogenase 3 / polyprenol reductase